MEMPVPATTSSPPRDNAPQQPADDWVLAALEPDQLVGAKTAHYPRAALGRGTRALLWAMRGYVVFMLVVVVYQIWTTVHAG